MLKLRSFALPKRCWYSARKYTPDHEWVTLKNGVATVGITDYAQKALGDVVYIEFPQIGTAVTQKGKSYILKGVDPLGAVESVKAASDIYAPITGSVLEINEELENKPGLLNSSPFDKGWIVKLKCSDEKQLESLLDEASYKKHIDSL